MRCGLLSKSFDHLLLNGARIRLQIKPPRKWAVALGKNFSCCCATFGHPSMHLLSSCINNSLCRRCIIKSTCVRYDRPITVRYKIYTTSLHWLRLPVAYLLRFNVREWISVRHPINPHVA